ncbi:MAG: hypothetical protein WC208_01985 [Gallionella sp.]
MEKNAFRSTIKLILAAALISLLGACASKSPANVSAQSNQTPSVDLQKDNSSGNAGENSAFKSQQVMTPHDSIEKDKLLVSYNMKVVPAETGYLIQISMVFTNMKDRSVSIKPKITLTDSKGSRIEAYTKTGFLKLVSRKTGKASTNAGSSSDEKTKWANSYWLKNSFSIPAHGIEIGELIYHCSNVNPPMKLTVNSAGQNYVFNINDTITLVGNQRDASKIR